MGPRIAHLSRARFVVCAAACLAVLLAPARSFATHWIVDQSGGGDFTTIQAAIDAIQNGLGWRDSVLVMPGTYLETISAANGVPYVIASVGGAESTVVNSFDYPSGNCCLGLVEGFTFAQAVQFYPGYGTVLMKGCVFLESVTGSWSSPAFEDCDFYAIATFLPLQSSGGRPSILTSRFHSAPLHLSTDVGDIQVQNCSFAGPADTLLYCPYISQSNNLRISGCRFERARFGLVTGDGYDGGYGISGCLFADLSEAGVWHDAELADQGHHHMGLSVWDSRFERCGTAVHWIHDGSGEVLNTYAFLSRDTVLVSGGDGIVLGPSDGNRVLDCVVDGSGGHGMVMRQTTGTVDINDLLLSAGVVRRSLFTNSRGDGLVITDQDTIPNELRTELWPALAANWQPQVVDSCLFANNDGTGLRTLAPMWRVTNSVAIGNSVDGFSLARPAAGLPICAQSNTSVLNRGTGIKLVSIGSLGDSVTSIRHNLAALNVGPGFRMPPQSSGSFAFNDAWSNYQGQYVGAWGSADSNLTVDPRFCDLGAGDLGLQQGSPAGAGGLYGLVGALPEQCPNTTVVEPRAPRLSFAVRPSVAHGSVEFVPPSSGPDGRVEIFDVAGRRHWGAVFGPTTGALRWTGQSEAGHAKPGLYWVRFTRAGESQSQRLVWLR